MTALKARTVSETHAQKGVREPDLALLGNGAFSLTGWDVGTPVRDDLPFVAIVANNSSMNQTMYK